MGLTMGDISSWLGLSPETIRFYESNDIISPKRRYDSTYREFDAEDILDLFYNPVGSLTSLAKCFAFCCFSVEVVLKLKFPNNSIIFLDCMRYLSFGFSVKNIAKVFHEGSLGSFSQELRSITMRLKNEAESKVRNRVIIT